MSESNDNKPTRRDFFRAVARAAAAAALAGGAAALIATGKVGSPIPMNRDWGPLPRQQCPSSGICRGCNAYEGGPQTRGIAFGVPCRLPQALSARQAGMKGIPIVRDSESKWTTRATN